MLTSGQILECVTNSMDPIMNIWDIAPLKPIVTEARGVFINLDGVDNAMGTSSVAYNSMLHKELMDLI